ncbi:MAG: protein kinase [Gemmatimonadales bacterium]|jgi:serine/threonine-protein kinase|nr:protein kinase [Gemmatimonadales bacterium]
MERATTPELRDRLQRVLGSQYRLERELGRGGMGVVWEATDTALERQVAIKAVHPELTHHDKIVRRFLSEARMIAKLRHPSIVTVHAAGGGDGLLYYVMDQVPGETLRDRLVREPKLPVEEARRITAELASALDTAARAGLVHRDVKPENILLDRASGRALLADFGIARAMESDPGSGDTTGAGVAVGTPTYMSPEQASGEDVDARSDLYALGVVAYEMLAGQPPFTGPTRVVVSRHLSERPVPLQKLRGECPAPLADAVMRALEKQPESRWQHGEEFRAAVVGERAVPRARRARWPFAAAAAVLLAVGALAVRAAGPDGPPAGVNPRHSFLVLPFTNLQADSASAWLGEGSVSMLSLSLGQWSDLQVVGPERVHDLLEKHRVAEGASIGLADATAIARHAGVWTVVLGSFERSRDSLRLDARVIDVATGREVDRAVAAGPSTPDVRPLFDQLASQLLDLSGAPQGVRVGVAQATTHSLDAYRAFLQASDHLNHWNLGEAEVTYRKALAHDSTFGLAYYKLAVTRGWTTGTDDSVASQAIARAELHADRLPWREQTMIRAYRTFIEGRHAEARTLYQQLIDRDPNDPDAWYGLGDAWFHDEVALPPARFTPSLRAFKRALALDPGYALAFEHVSFLLGLASRAEPGLLLLPGDSIAFAAAMGQRPDSAAVQADVARARAEAVRLARDWVALQPATPRAHEALLAALLAAGDDGGATVEIARFRSVLPTHPELPFDAARAQLARGDIAGATTSLAGTIDSLTPADFDRLAGAPDAAERVAAAANHFAYRGNVERAARVVGLATRARMGAPAPGTPAAVERDLHEWRMLGELYAAVGAPANAMRRVWDNAAETARSLPKERRARAVAAGGTAAVGLLTTLAPDASALRELETMTGQAPVKEVRALLALQRNDSATARRALEEAEPASSGAQMKPGYLVFRRPLAAQAWYLLGEYDRALSALDGFEPAQFNTGTYDMRWGMVGRVRLLRGAVLEKLGRDDAARREYRLALEQWEAADPELREFVEEAEKGLARVEGRG